ncbi:MAG: hypothetical protein PHO14_01910 [Kiritimatiellae bacterium]|jgi:hypothetical protein|nr:hypothetical protein [Kiritimatiellia bacterium]MDD4340971.1 hypothetical protein [Kiritimatiellia bacterium]
MNDMFIGDSDFVEIAQRTKLHKKLEKQTQLLEENWRVEKARLTEVQHQTKILQEQALLQKEAQTKAEENRKYLQTKRKLLVMLTAGLQELSHKNMPIHSVITYDDIDLYGGIIGSKYLLEMIEEEDRLEAIEDIKYLKEAMTLVDKLINHDHADIISHVSGVIESTKKHEIYVKNKVNEFRNKIERIKNKIHDDTTLVSARNEIISLEKEFKKITVSNIDKNIYNLMQFYSVEPMTYKSIKAVHQLDIQVLIQLCDFSCIVKKVLAVKYSSADFFSCTYSDIESSDNKILSLINKKLNLKTIEGTKMAKVLFFSLFFKYEDSNDIHSLIKCCEYALQNGCKYLETARHSIHKLIKRTDTCLSNNRPYEHYKIKKESGVLLYKYNKISNDINLVAKLNVVESIQSNKYLSRDQYSELRSKIKLLDEKLNKLVKICNKPFLIRYWWIILIPPSAAIWIYLLSTGF